MSDLSINPTVGAPRPAAPAATPAGGTSPAADPGAPLPTMAGDASTVVGRTLDYTEVWAPVIDTPETEWVSPEPEPQPAAPLAWAEPAITERWDAEIIMPAPPKPPIEGG